MSKPNEINIPAIIEDLDKSGKNAVILEWTALNGKKQTVTILSSNKRADIEDLVKMLEKFESTDAELKAEYV